MSAINLIGGKNIQKSGRRYKINTESTKFMFNTTDYIHTKVIER